MLQMDVTAPPKHPLRTVLTHVINLCESWCQQDGTDVGMNSHFGTSAIYIEDILWKGELGSLNKSLAIPIGETWDS